MDKVNATFVRVRYTVIRLVGEKQAQKDILVRKSRKLPKNLSCNHKKERANAEGRMNPMFRSE